SLPHWSYRIPGPPPVLVAIFLLCVALLAATLRSHARWARWLRQTMTLALLVSALLIATYPFSPQFERGRLETTVLDVGQGDSGLVVSPSGHALLIDGGGAFAGFAGRPERNGIDPGEEAVSPYLWARGFQRIDVVALTHAHQDHLGGLAAVLENF